jgi:hypothetical protein
MKIIFLDNDGVICLGNNWGSRFKKQDRSVAETVADKDLPVEQRFDNFDKKAMGVLNEILEETGAQIIVSSDWRLFATIEELGEYYKSQGILRGPIGGTEIFDYTKWKDEGLFDEDFPWDRYYSREQERHFEILRWLRDNAQEMNVTHWVAIDDLNMGKEIHTRYGHETRTWGLTNFVWTPLDYEGIKQCGKKEKILEFLNSDI